MIWHRRYEWDIDIRTDVLNDYELAAAKKLTALLVEEINQEVISDILNS